jgi:hypothetical protein
MIRLFTAFLASALVLFSAPAPIEVPAGTHLSIRLRGSVSTKHSRPGDSVPAVLIAPVEVDGKELIPSGFLVKGTVAEPTEAHKRLNHFVLYLHFGDLIGKSNRSLPFQARVLSVDNGRESVDSEGVIHGLRPLRRQPSEIEDVLMLAAYAHPAVLASLELGRFIVAEEEKPRVEYGPGVELWLTLTSRLQILGMPQPEMMHEPASLRPSPDLKVLVSSLPLRTSTPAGVPSDLINFVFLGSQDDLASAFLDAGWLPAEKLDVKTEAQTFFAVAYHHSYREGPVSNLMIDGQRPALVYEKATNTFSKRHHIRIWPRQETYHGKSVWVGAATHDIGIDFSRKARTFSHSVDRDIDRERQKVQDDLIFTGKVSASGLLGRPAAPRSFQNATGDHLQTDGDLAAMLLAR